MPVRTVIEHGTKDKRSVAFSLDWPGWSRGAKTAELALETLESYRERYRPIATLAGMAREFDAAGPLEVVEDRVGTGSTDFWGDAQVSGPYGFWLRQIARQAAATKVCMTVIGHTSRTGTAQYNDRLSQRRAAW